MLKEQKMKFVIAEDNFLVSEDISHLLESLGYEKIGDASDGLEAVEMVCEKRPDVVLMDIKMPKLNGLEATRQIQERCPTPVVVLTAFESQELVEKASEAGVGAYLTKPTRRDEIERAITIAIARHRDLMELRRLNIDLNKEVKMRIKTEKRLKGLLQEKDVLLKEIHHRVKNNFTVVSSLLSLQSGNIEKKKVKEIFEECRNRIKTMAMIHEQLYQSKDLANIQFIEYITSLTRNLFESYKIDSDKVLLESEIEDISLGVDKAIPCGLIVNELITNALNHAFPSNRPEKGKITISLRLIQKNIIELIVSDNGRGMSDEIDIEQSDTLGLRLVSILIEDQLLGTLKLLKENGTTFKITFPR